MIECKNSKFVPLAADFFRGDFPKDKIQILEISYSDIKEIPAGYFESLKSLKELNIINSNITVLHNNSFEGKNISKLK